MKELLHSPSTLFRNPLHASELRALPQFRIYHEALMDKATLVQFFRIVELMKQLAPIYEGDTRSVWIEVVRGRPSEWRNYAEMVAKGAVTSRKEYLELWEFENPDEVTWWRIGIDSYKDVISLTITDGKEYYTAFCNRTCTSDSALPESIVDEHDRDNRHNAEQTLERLTCYLKQLVSSVQWDPGEYNDYIEANLPRCFRRGTIPLREYRLITGEDPRRDLPEGAESYLEKKASETEKDAVMARPMTIRLYAQAWITAYKALYGELVNLDEECRADDFLAFQRINSFGSYGHDPDRAQDFKKWMNEAGVGHAFELPIYSGIEIRPIVIPEGSLLVAIARDESSIGNAIIVSQALEKAQLKVLLKGAADMLRYVRGDCLMNFDPRGEASFKNPRCRFPERATEDLPQETLDALDRATMWVPLKRVIPIGEILQEDRD